MILFMEILYILHKNLKIQNFLISKNEKMKNAKCKKKSHQILYEFENFKFLREISQKNQK